MKLLLIVLSFVAISMAHAETLESVYAAKCQAAIGVQPEVDDVEKSMRNLLSLPNDNAGHVAQLDQDLITRTRTMMNALAPTKRTAMLKILSSVNWFNHRTLRGMLVAPEKFTLLLFGVAKKRAGLFLNEDFKQSEYLRMRLVRELRRAVDLVVDEDPLEALGQSIEAQKQRRMGVYRLEVPGLREQYRWLRTHYSPKDANRFRWPILLKGISSDEMAFQKRQLKRIDAAMAGEIKDAWASNEADYVKLKLKQFRSEQRILNLGLKDQVARAKSIWNNTDDWAFVGFTAVILFEAGRWIIGY